MKLTKIDIEKEYDFSKRHKTADLHAYCKKKAKENVDVSELKGDEKFKYFYLVIKMQELKSWKEQLDFVEENFSTFNYWADTDMLLQFFIKPLDYDYVFEKTKKYVVDKRVFARRFGYVIFIAGLQKDPNNFERTASLFHNDDAHDVQMAEAWLLADLAVYAPIKALVFLEKTKIKYNIMGKAIQKMCDSFRISEEDKNRAKALREKLRNN